MASLNFRFGEANIYWQCQYRLLEFLCVRIWRCRIFLVLWVFFFYLTGSVLVGRSVLMGETVSLVWIWNLWS